MCISGSPPLDSLSFNGFLLGSFFGLSFKGALPGSNDTILLSSSSSQHSQYCSYAEFILELVSHLVQKSLSLIGIVF